MEPAQKIFQKLSVLVIHADDNMVRLLGSILTSLGVRQIHNTTDAEHALRLLGEARADLVLTGYRMRPLDGISLSRRIRDEESSANPYVPIVMVTGNATPEMVTRAREAGVNEFLVTPVSVKAVADRIAVAVGRPRPFVKARDYFGPDRRRRNGAVGQDRRGPGPKKGDDNGS